MVVHIFKISDDVKIIPLVDDEFKVVDFFEYKQNLYFPVAIPNLAGNELKYLTDAFMSSWISSSGEYIEKFENEFAEFTIKIRNSSIFRVYNFNRCTY